MLTKLSFINFIITNSTRILLIFFSTFVVLKQRSFDDKLPIHTQAQFIITPWLIISTGWKKSSSSNLSTLRATKLHTRKSMAKLEKHRKKFWTIIKYCAVSLIAKKKFFGSSGKKIKRAATEDITELRN